MKLRRRKQQVEILCPLCVEQGRGLVAMRYVWLPDLWVCPRCRSCITGEELWHLLRWHP